MILDRPLIVPCKVPVRMMREIAHRRLVGFRLHGDGKAVILIEVISDPRLESAGIAFLAICRNIRERNTTVRWLRLGRPQALLEALRSAVQLMPAPVLGELVHLSIAGASCV